MCPENAKIFLAEDDHSWREFNQIAVTRAGHKVVVEVGDVAEGLAAIPEAEKLGVNVALLDGKIPFGRSDGSKLAAALREKIPGIKVVDISAFGDAVAGADATMPKAEFNIERLGKLVTEL